MRSEVMGEVDRPATRDGAREDARARRQGMQHGAFGLSSGLFYVPGTFTPTEEVIELARVAGAMGGIYISHMRDEAKGLLDSVRETIAIGEKGGLPTQITHHKVVGKTYWGGSSRRCAWSTRRGRAASTRRSISIRTPRRHQHRRGAAAGVGAGRRPRGHAQAAEGSGDAREDQGGERRDHPRRARRRRSEERRGSALPVRSVARRARTSRRSRRAAASRSTLENAAETALWIVEQGGCGGIFHAIGEEDLQRILVHPATMIASDGEVPIFGRNVPHPRSYGTFARVLGVYVRDKKLLPLEAAVQKMSAFPAQRLGLSDRGVLRAGLKADIAVFDRGDGARHRDIREAAQLCRRRVAGDRQRRRWPFEDGKMTAARPGRVLYGPARK